MALNPGVIVTHTAPTNIACIKYWGKRDTKWNLPINSSVSVTMNQDDLHAKTTVCASPDFTADRLWLNGKEEDVAGNKRIMAVMSELRSRAEDRVAADGTIIVSRDQWASYKVHMVSENSFPTAAGLASSAAGYACMVSALADLFCVKERFPGELTAIARQGSGSACRSLFGGFVRWNMGSDSEGKDSIAEQVADEKHWPELEVLICVVSDKKKDTGSTEGMSTSVATSELLKYRAASVVQPRLDAIEAAYKARDFATFGKITMQDSNQFHACCLDTYPPIFYMNDVSKSIISLVHAINAAAGQVIVAYTFDAGPNAVLFTTKPHTTNVLSVLLNHFDAPETSESKEGSFVSNPTLEATARATPSPWTALHVAAPARGAVQHIYHTTVGDGPRHLPIEQALVDPATGLPKRLAH